MMRYLLLLLLFICGLAVNAQTLHTITQTSFTFTPQVLTITQGDNVQFVFTTGTHNAMEVTETAYNNNSANPIVSGGFQINLMRQAGTYQVPAGTLTVGTHYYVCTPHAAQGQKGMIIVNPSNTGINTPTNPMVKIVPNPAHSLVRIKFTENSSVRNIVVNDITGRMLKKDQVDIGEMETTWDISTWKAGIYIVQFLDDRNKVLLRQKLEVTK